MKKSDMNALDSKNLLYYLRKHKLKFSISITLSFIASILVVMSPWLMGLITDEIGNNLNNSGLVNVGGLFNIKIVILLAVIIVFYLIAYGIYYLVSHILLTTTQEITLTIRKDVIQKINAIPISYFQNNSSGDTLTKMTNLIETINNALLQNVNQVIKAVTLVVALIIVMFVINPILATIVVVFFAISICCSTYLMKKSYPDFIRHTKAYGVINGHFEEAYSKRLTIKLYDYQKRSSEKFDELNKEIYDSSFKSLFKSSIMRPLEYLTNSLSYILVIVVGAILVTKTSITIGGLLTYILYTKQIAAPNEQLINGLNALQASYAALVRIFKFLNKPDEVETGKKELETTKGSIRFVDVGLVYSDGAVVLSDVSFKVSKGKKTALIGGIGGGKSSLLKLLMRFYDCSRGYIEIDGVNIKSYTRSSIRNHISYLPGDAFVFSGTILDNILYGSSNKTQLDVVEVIKRLNLTNFISSFQGGLDYFINEDKIKLSLGEKQLIAICRVSLSSKPIIVIDEGTSAIDSKTEKILSEILESYSWQKTIIIVKKDNKGLELFDQIVVMEQGKILAKGTYQQLFISSSQDVTE